MILRQYLKRKFNKLYKDEVPTMNKADSCLFNLWNCYNKLMKSKRMTASKQDYYTNDFDFWFVDYYKIEGDLPNNFGQYIHICNNGIPNIADFMNIQGEVCFSDLGANQHIVKPNQPVVGLIVEATPEQSFSYDCWSEIDNTGLRIANAESCDFVNFKRPEYWIIPAKSKIIGIAYNDKVNQKTIDSLMEQIGINHFFYIVPFNAVNL